MFPPSAVCKIGRTVNTVFVKLIGYVIGEGLLLPHCYTPMDNQYARSKEVNAESGAATLKANPLSVT